MRIMALFFMGIMLSASFSQPAFAKKKHKGKKMKQCIYNDSAVSFKVDYYKSEKGSDGKSKGKRTKKNKTFNFGNTLCHFAKNETNGRIFVLKPQGCQAIGWTVGAVAVVGVGAAIAMTGGTLAAGGTVAAGAMTAGKLAGGVALSAYSTFGGIGMFQAANAINKKLDKKKIQIAAPNMKQGGYKVAITGNCFGLKTKKKK